ncbi:hypothetical protein LOD99_9186 [Oopsacas minuta]|uniref:Uncharacterized protein n=1 Tax=Oopsacas minuta TaxID=111878 RepID=A0AAV7JDC4_9METZ|nr:hypothetical protein LOD99_9186 [Oopsacas minuta]
MDTTPANNQITDSPKLSRTSSPQVDLSKQPIEKQARMNKPIVSVTDNKIPKRTTAAGNPKGRDHQGFIDLRLGTTGLVND